jgi:hypothetical protein
VARTAASVRNSPGTPEWVACAGMTRDVVDGRVACPKGNWRAVGDCLDCRELLTTSNERSDSTFCELPEADWEAPG